MRAASVFLVGLVGFLFAFPLFGATPPGPRDVGSQNEKDWIDNRWSRTDVGQFLSSLVDTPHGTVARGLSIKVGSRDEGTVCFDSKNLSWRAAWTGGFLVFDAARYGLIKIPKIDGSIVWSQGATPGWVGSSNRFSGLHLSGKRVVLEYRVGGMKVLDSPWLDKSGNSILFTRSLEVAPCREESRVVVASTPGETAAMVYQGGLARAVVKTATNVFIVALFGDAKLVSEKGRIVAVFPAHARLLRAKILFSSGDPSAQLPVVDATQTVPEDLTALSQPGPARWLPELKTRGQRSPSTDILAVDTLTVPYDNPWKALMFLAGVDFTPDGAAWVCSIHGDVWRITGIDATLGELRWKRFATGLFQPLGLKVRDGKVLVLGRDQVTRLHDMNGDGEADFYESFCNLIETSSGTHDFVTCLETDLAGNLYYVDPRGVHRISPDGLHMETIASGWRNPNGMGVSPDGKIITVAPQQGEWTPSSQISEAKSGAYYGYGGPRIIPGRPLGYNDPLCWIPHEIDNSSGSQVWIPEGKWGPLAGHMIHLLWGRCGMMLVLRDEVNGTPQGAVVPLPGRLLSGPNRGTFHPREDALYIAGSTGWQTSAARDGALQRIRFTERPVVLPIGWRAHRNGIDITFSAPLDPAAARDAGSFGVTQWNYRYAAQYGSKDWSVANPAKPGRDELEVKSARLLPDGRTVFLEMPGLQRVMQMEVKYSLNDADGKPVRNQFWLTLNELDVDR
ncbi:MAG: hypothetical protein QOF48_4044 [Verrucomicrobiota bacterium]|jgi:hypothetical protein